MGPEKVRIEYINK